MEQCCLVYDFSEQGVAQGQDEGEPIVTLIDMADCQSTRF